MSTSPNAVIGYIVDVQGNLLVATLIEDEQGHAPIVTIGDEDVLVGQLGSYVAVKQNDVHLIAVVTRMSEQESLAGPTIETTGDDAARLPFAKRIARLTPVGSIIENGRFERGVAQYPTTGAEVHAIGSADIARMFDRFQSKGLAVGTLASHPSLRVYLDPTNLFGRHLAILGQTGAGKSWTVATIVQKTVAAMKRAHIIILDLHGEYCWNREDGSRHYAFANTIVRHVDARDLEIPYWLMTYAELCDLLIEHSEREATNQTAFFRDCLLEGRKSENASATPVLGLSRVTVDTPILFLFGRSAHGGAQQECRACRQSARPNVRQFRPIPDADREQAERSAVRFSAQAEEAQHVCLVIGLTPGLCRPGRSEACRYSYQLEFSTIRCSADGCGADWPLGIRAQLLEPEVPRVSDPPYLRGSTRVYTSRE